MRIIDKNESWAAIDDGILAKDSRIIMSSTKEYKKGDVVRWEEE